jgi:hypothetical protein
MTVKVTGEELSRFNENDTTLAFKDGSGFLAEMAVYHELHCVVCHFQHLAGSNTEAHSSQETNSSLPILGPLLSEYDRRGTNQRGHTYR